MRDFSSTIYPAVWVLKDLFSSIGFNCTNHTYAKQTSLSIKTGDFNKATFYKANLFTISCIRSNNSWKLRAKEANHREVSEHANDHIVFYSFFLLKYMHYQVLSAQVWLTKFFKLTYTDTFILSFPNMWFKQYCSWDVANTEAPLFLQHRHFNLYIPELPELVEQFISEIYAHEI